MALEKMTAPEFNSNDVRSTMVQYWDEHSTQGSMQEMFNDDFRLVELVRPDDTAEVLDMLPDTSDAHLLELGAGVGRFTGQLAHKAKSVVAVDFMQNFTDRNKEVHGHMTNIQFIQADATKLQQPKESLDMVFSNWLLMYLDEQEVKDLFTNILRWLRPGGHFFFRESCFHPGGRKRDFNPTKYRNPAQYNLLYQSASILNDDGGGAYVFEMVVSRSIQAYVKHKNNSNQVAWLLQKVHQDQAANHGFKTFQEFLDNQQYSRNSILRYEKIFGRNFISPGGKDTTEEFVSLLDLKQGQYVLDVGCGIGGSAFYMAQEHGVHVLGIDLSANMIAIGLERANEIQDKRVQLEVADTCKRTFPDNTFDVIYSRDTFLHIKDKRGLLSKLLSWLKPGGKLLISDYSCRDDMWSDQFQKYVSQRGYHLTSINQYSQLLEVVGFTNVLAQDRTSQFVKVLGEELTRTMNMRDQFIQEFSQEDYDAMVSGWQDKLDRCAQGDQKWGLFYAEKPLSKP